MLHAMECYIKLIRTYLKSITVYRGSVLLALFAVVLVNGTTFIGIWLVMYKFGEISGWTLGEITFVFSLSLITYGVRNLLFYKFTELSHMVQRGELDIVLTKPLNPFVYIMGSRFEIGGAAYIFLGLILIFRAGSSVDIMWNLHNILFFIITVFSGSLVQGAITVVMNTFAFYLHETKSLNRLYGSMREFIWYPVSLYNNAVKFILFFVIPFAFASYVPAGIFLDNSDYSVFPVWVWQVSLLSGPFFFIIAYLFWKNGLRHYNSTGN